MLRTCIGEGATGEVWEASDRLTDSAVAVKLFSFDTFEPARVRREIAALRLLRLPGIAQLLDEGSHNGRPFLIMELIQGAPFPGRGVASSWSEMAPVVMQLLETLARVHAAGIVHRDLKPANVLVDAARRPTVLDFGLSAGTVLGSKLTQEGYILGTPTYLAPEQIRGQDIGPWTDLYAVGAMIYEVLGGAPPHAPWHSYEELFYRRLNELPAPLDELAPGVPRPVARLVAQLLRTAGDERPQSATEVLSLLDFESDSSSHLGDMRLLGTEWVAQVIQLLGAGRSVDVVGVPGSGRSRCLQGAAADLQERGYPVLSTQPSSVPFASLEPVIGGLEELSDRPLDVVTGHVRDAVTGLLGSGTIMIADDVQRLDRWSRAVIEDCLSAGPVARVMSPVARGTSASATVTISPLTETELRRIFAGHDRIFHLREDAARALWARTQGLLSEISEEIAAWVRAGIARWDGARVAVDREALDRLALAGTRSYRAWRKMPELAGAGHLAELLSWIVVAASNADAELLARAMQRPRWRVEAEIDELVDRHAVRRLANGRVESLLSFPQRWSADKRRLAHGVVADLVPSGVEGRLFHLVASEAGDSRRGCVRIAHEAVTFARRCARDGRLGNAVAVLDQGLLALRQGRKRFHAEELTLLREWVAVALAEATAPALDRILYEITRSGLDSPGLEQLHKLVRAALAALSTGGERALQLVDAVSGFDDTELERQRQEVRVWAARRCEREREQEVVAKACAWADSTGDARIKASAAGWLGLFRYRQGRFDEAALLHDQAASGETWVIRKLAAQLHAASAHMEAFRLLEAGERARAARALADECRQPFYEARAEWILRTVAYRLDRAPSVDRELVEIVARVGVIELEALVSSTEAAVAWRAGEHELAVSLAMRAHGIWKRLGMRASSSLARALAIAAGDDMTESERSALVMAACGIKVPGLGIQVLGLVAMACKAREPLCSPDEVHRLASMVPRIYWSKRIDVLTVQEVMDVLVAGTRATVSP